MMVVDMCELCKNAYNIILCVLASYILIAVMNNNTIVECYLVAIWLQCASCSSVSLWFVCVVIKFD